MLGTFVAGRYSGVITYPAGSPLSLGILEEGWNIRWQHKKDYINRTDAYGDTTIEAFHQGLDMWVSGVAKEWLSGVIKTIQPFGGWAGTGASNMALGTIGVADTDNAGILVLTATAGTPAATSPASVTFTYAIQDENDVDMLFGPRHRTMPFTLRIYPYYSSAIRFFSST